VVKEITMSQILRDCCEREYIARLLQRIEIQKEMLRLQKDKIAILRKENKGVFKFRS